MPPQPQNALTAALSVLIVLQAIMLLSLYAGVPPHPPAATPLFGMGPFIGTAAAAALAAIILQPTHGLGRALALIAALCASVSFGPQKYVDPQFPLIWPAVLTAQIAIVAILVNVGRGLLAPSHAHGAI